MRRIVPKKWQEIFNKIGLTFPDERAVNFSSLYFFFSLSSFSRFLLLSLHYVQESKVTRNVKQAWSKFELTHLREWNFPKVIPVLKGDNIRYAHVHRFFRISLKIMFDQSRDIVGDAKPLRSLIVSFFFFLIKRYITNFTLTPNKMTKKHM